MNAAHSPTIVVICADPVVVMGLEHLIARCAPRASIRTFATLSVAAGVLQRGTPDLVVLDWDLPEAPGAAGVAALREVAPALNAVVFSGTSRPMDAAGVRQDGPLVFADCSGSYRRLLRSVRALVLRPAATAGGLALSSRQREVVRLIEAGQSTREIAVAMHVSAETVKSHMRAIFSRLHVTNRTQAVLRYRASAPSMA